MVDPLKVWPDEIAAMLEPGESALAAAAFQVAFGADRLDRSPEEIRRRLRLLPPVVREKAIEARGVEPPPRSWPRRAASRIFDAVTGGPSLIDFDPENAAGGVVAAGQVGSWAHRVSAAVSDYRVSSHCVVTDRRLIVADSRRSDEFVELLSVPREAISGARVTSRLIQRGRVALDFADSSRLVLMTGFLFTGAARRLVTALHCN